MVVWLFDALRQVRAFYCFDTFYALFLEKDIALYAWRLVQSFEFYIV
jgi:hypothetical protein